MSGASVSSFGSSVNGGSSVGTATRNGPRTDDGEIFEEPQTLQLGFFGVLYTVSKERELTSVKFAFFRLFLDFLQLWLLVVNPQYGWNIPAKNKVWQVVSFIQLNQFLTDRGYAFFLTFLYVFIGLLGVNMALSVWVANAFSNNRFEHVWPIQFLRWFGLIFYQVLDIATLTLLLVTLDCNYFNVASAIRFHNQEFPDVMCWSMPHIVHVAVSVVSIIMFSLMATAQCLSEMELNPLTRNYMAIAHTKVEGWCFAIKVIVTIASVMIATSTKWLAIVYLVCFATLFYLYVRWVPFIYSALNYVRCASYGIVLYSSMVLIALAFGPSKDEYRKAVTWALWGGMAPAAAFGALACHLRLRHFNKNVLGRFREAEHGTNSKTIYRFEDAREVEIAARCCRRWVDEDTLEPEAVELSEAIIKAGMLQLPQDPQMIILYSSFLIDVQGSYQSGYTQLQTAKKVSPGILERFAIFSREQAHTQKASGANNGTQDSDVDLVSYVEFQRNHRLVVRAHREALLAMRSFWGLLLRHHVSFNQLSKALHRIEVSVKGAERAYRGVIARHGTSPRIVRLYGRFLETVKFDPWAASKWYTEADRLEEEAELTREAMQLGGMEMLIPQASRPPGAASDRGPDMDGVAFICINAKGIIQVASSEAHSMLGYAKNELKGRDLGIILPPPFGERHSAYVRNYITTGNAALLDRNYEMVVISKNQQVIRAKIRVTKVSGLNEDSIFLGVIEPIDPPPTEARTWVLGNGTVVAADDRFCDWLGYDGTELPGLTLESLVADKEAMRQVLKGFAVTHHAAAFSSGLVNRPGYRRLSNAGEILEKAEKADKSLRGIVDGAGGAAAAGDKPSGTTERGSTGGNTATLDGKLNWLRRTVTTHGLVNGNTTSAGIAAPAPHAPVLLPRTAWCHKYSAPLGFDTSLQPGAFGSVKVHCIVLRRCRGGPDSPGHDAGSGALVGKHKGSRGATAVAFPPRPGRGHELPPANPPVRFSYDDMMLVADSKGRVLHVTTSLAEALGTTTLNLRNGGLGMLIHEPTSVLHGPWLQELANPQSTTLGPANMAPPYSCRRGVPVCLATHHGDGQGPGSVSPFKLTVDQRTVDGGGFRVHVVSLKPLTIEQALSERRLTLTVDLTGGILAADEDTPAELFGADPRALAGKSVGQLIDLFRADAPGRLTLDDGSVAADAVASTRRLTKALLELARRDTETPGCSWRVGVHVQPNEAARKQLDRLSALLGPEDAGLAAQFNGAKTIPAVMRVCLVSQPKKSAKEAAQSAPTSSPGHAGGVTWMLADDVPRPPAALRNGPGASGPVAEAVLEEETEVEPFSEVVRPQALGRVAWHNPWTLGTRVRPGPIAEATETPGSKDVSPLNAEDEAALNALAESFSEPKAPPSLPPQPPAPAATLPSAAPASGPPSSAVTLAAELATVAEKLQLASASVPGAVAAAGQAQASRASSARRRSTDTAYSATLPLPPPALLANPADADGLPTPKSTAPAATTAAAAGVPAPPLPPQPSGTPNRPNRRTSKLLSQSFKPDSLLETLGAKTGSRLSGLGMMKDRPVSLRLPPEASAAVAAALAVSTPPSTDNGDADAEEENYENLVFEVELWRADLLSGVLEVDERGRVLRADADSPLGCSDLVLGVPLTSLTGTHVGALIPLPPGGVVGLLETTAADANGPGPSVVRGALKKRVSKQTKAGAPVVLSTRHQSDGCPMALTVQAVRRAGPNGSAFLLLHPASPTAVQAGFSRWVHDSDMSLLMPAHAATVGALGDARLTALGLASMALLNPEACDLPRLRGSAVLLNTDASDIHSKLKMLGRSHSTNARARAMAGILGSGDFSEVRGQPPVPGAVWTATANGITSATTDQAGNAIPSPFLSTDPRAGSLRVPNPPSELPSPLNTVATPLHIAAMHGAAVAANVPGRAPQHRLSLKGTPTAAVDSSEDADGDAPTDGDGAGAPAAAGARGPRKTESTDMASMVQDTAFEQLMKEKGWKVKDGARFPALQHQDTSDDPTAPSPARSALRQGADLQKPANESAPSPKRPTSRLDAKKHNMVSSWVMSGQGPGQESMKVEAPIPNAIQDDTDGPTGEPSEHESEDHHSSSKSGSGDGSGDHNSSDHNSSGKNRRSENGGGGGGDSSRGSDTDGDIENEAGAVVANYQVGKRFKKLFKILTSPLAQQPSKKLRWRSMGAVMALLAAHTATFVLLLTQLLQQQTAVEDLDSAAMAACRIHEIATAGRVIDKLYAGNSYVPDLPIFGDSLDYALNETYTELSSLLASLQTLHRGVYVGTSQRRRISSDFGLRDIWDVPSLNITIFYDAYDPNDTSRILPNVEPPAPSYALLGLWDAGNMFLTNGLELHNKGPSIVAQGANFTNWSTWRFIQANGLTVINPAYLATLDALVQLTVEKSQAIYQLQLIILCLEGGVLCLLACAYMAYVATKFSKWRYKLYEVFVQIPLGVTRGLANMSLKLEANDESDEDENGLHIHHVLSADHGGLHHLHALGEEEEHNTLTDGAVKAAANGHHSHGDGSRHEHGDKKSFSARRRGGLAFAVDGAAAGDEGPSMGAGSMAVRAQPEASRGSRLWGFALGGLSAWRNRSKVAPGKPAAKTKRRLLPSQRLAYSLLAPFVLWGLAIIVVNVVGYTDLKSMTAPIATLNVVNVVLIRVQRILYYVVEVAAAYNLDSRSAFKGTLSDELGSLQTEYAVMLYGNEATANTTATHFRLAETGVVFGDFGGPSTLLFNTHDCLCANQTQCQPVNSTMYEVTHNGLNVLLLAEFKYVSALVTQPLETSDMNSTDFRAVWSLGPTDVDGGMNMMSSLFLNEVQGSYNAVCIQQIVMFAIAWIWGLGFVVLQLRPLMRRSRSEMRRIAELLSQLPGEVDCEALIMGVILAEQGAAMHTASVTASLFGRKGVLGGSPNNAAGSAAGGAGAGGGGGGLGGGFGGVGGMTLKSMTAGAAGGPSFGGGLGALASKMGEPRP